MAHTDNVINTYLGQVQRKGMRFCVSPPSFVMGGRFHEIPRGESRAMIYFPTMEFHEEYPMEFHGMSDGTSHMGKSDTAVGGHCASC